MLQTFQLVIKSGPNVGKVIPLAKDEMTIGRDVGVDIIIPDAEVSRKHARLYMQGGGYVLEDLGSTNGCFVNGQRLLGPHALRPGELIMLGENVAVVYEIVQVDPDATVISSAGVQAEVPAPMPAYPPPPPAYEAPKPSYAPPPASFVPEIPPPPPPVYESPAPVFSGQVPAGPEEALAEPPAKKTGSKTWLLAGCGCLVVLLCIGLVGAYIFDSLNLYCVSPFDAIFGALGFCP